MKKILVINKIKIKVEKYDMINLWYDKIKVGEIILLFILLLICIFIWKFLVFIKFFFKFFSFVFNKNGIVLVSFMNFFLVFVNDVIVCFFIMFFLLDNFIGIKF